MRTPILGTVCRIFILSDKEIELIGLLFEIVCTEYHFVTLSLAHFVYSFVLCVIFVNISIVVRQQ